LTVWATEARLEPKVRSDLFIDFHFGQHRSSIEGIIDQFGSLFISDDEQKALGKFSDGTKKSEFLKKAAAPKLEHLWYLVVSICRILQSEDFTLNANEAYWLGLVDEIQGSDLPNLRELLEVRSAPRRSAPTNAVPLRIAPARHARLRLQPSRFEASNLAPARFDSLRSAPVSVQLDQATV
jgi:hypothetical protein